MSHTEGRQCPECGRTWKRESKLYTRKRRRLAFVGAVLLFIGALPAHRAEDIKALGWTGGMPGWAFLLALPWLDSDEDGSDTVSEMYRNRSRERVGIRSALRAELVRRATADDVTPIGSWICSEWSIRHVERIVELYGDETPDSSVWFEASLLDAAARHDHMSDGQRDRASALVTVAIEHRSPMPVGVRIPATIETRRLTPVQQIRLSIIDPRTSSTVYQRVEVPHVGPTVKPFINVSHFVDSEDLHRGRHALGAASAGRDDLTYILTLERPSGDAQWTEFHRRSISVSVTGHGDLTEYVTPVAAPALTHALASMRIARPRREWDHVLPTMLAVESNPVSSAMRTEGVDVLAVRFEIRDGDRVLATRDGCWSAARRDGTARRLPDGTAAPPTLLAVDRIPSATDDLATRELTVRIISVAELALRDDHATTYWDGTVEVPLREYAESSDEAP